MKHGYKDIIGSASVTINIFEGESIERRVLRLVRAALDEWEEAEENETKPEPNVRPSSIPADPDPRLYDSGFGYSLSKKDQKAKEEAIRATCRTCGGWPGHHRPSVLDPNGVSDPGHRTA